jgi:hypothetical protein
MRAESRPQQRVEDDKENNHQNKWVHCLARCLSLGLLLLLGLPALGAALSLDVLVINSKGLVNLGLQGTFVLDAVY